MSLDVHLTLPFDRDSGEEPQAGGRIYIRRDGKTEEVSREEWNELYPGREPVVAIVEERSGVTYWRNVTHNLGRMAREAGCYEACWRPDEHGMTHARDLIRPLRDALAALQSDPEHFKQFNPENGWGDYDGFVDFVADYLGACERWPAAEVYASG